MGAVVLLAVLSDSNKRFLYDVGVYDSDDDEDDVRKPIKLHPEKNPLHYWFPENSRVVSVLASVCSAVGHGRLPRRDGRHDEPGHANGNKHIPT